MTDDDIHALQDFSDAFLAAQPDVVRPEDYGRLAECLRSPRIDSLGASFAARIAIATRLRALPFITTAAIGRLEPDFRSMLLAYLENGILLDEFIEILLTRMRRAIFLDLLAGAEVDAFGLDLMCALAIFCFHTEYVFAEGEMETRALAILETRPSAAAAAIFGCYRPLTRYAPLASVGEASGLTADLIRVQVTEPREEKTIAPAIQSLSPITDATSLKVRGMYEENPYPRWKSLPPVRGERTFAQHEAILIAGCGTGQHAMLSARAHPAARILAVDISRASLAYGQRKARECGFSNIEFRHGDILELPATGARFSLISCIGVLHHMQSPEAGLDALVEVLADGGAVELGLYTESGRTEVVGAIALREQLGIPATPEGIRHLRQVIFGLPDGHPAKFARESLDFYNMSGCRDYLFHVQEHRLTLPRIDTMLRRAGLKLQKIALKSGSRAEFKRMFGDETDPLQWHEYERLHPGCFGSMYEMVVEKR